MRETLIRITNASRDGRWYRGVERRVFKVYDAGRDYVLKEDYDSGHDTVWRHVEKADCEEVEKCWVCWGTGEGGGMMGPDCPGCLGEGYVVRLGNWY